GADDQVGGGVGRSGSLLGNEAVENLAERLRRSILKRDPRDPIARLSLLRTIEGRRSRSFGCRHQPVPVSIVDKSNVTGPERTLEHKQKVLLRNRPPR